MTAESHAKSIASGLSSEQRLDRLYTAARDMVVDPHNMELRRRFVSLTFNIDRLAMAIVELGDRDPDRGSLKIHAASRAAPLGGAVTGNSGNSK